MIISNFSRIACCALVAFGVLGLNACPDGTSTTLSTTLPDPIITSLQPDTGAPGSEVLITGNNFGNNSSQIRILIGGQVPQGITAVEPGKSVRFLVPTLEANKYEVQLILGNRLSNSKSFTVLDPSSTTEPGFTVGLSVLELETKYGASKTGDSILTLTPQNGFTGQVNLELLNAPAGMSVNPASTSITSKDAKQVPIHLELGTNVKPGNYAITLKASSGGIERKIDLWVPVSTFSASLLGGDVFNLAQGSNMKRDLIISPWNGFTGTINLSLLEAPVDLSLTTATFTVATSSNSTSGVTFKLNTNAPAGRYTFKLHVSSDGFARDIPLTMQVADFAATLNPNPVIAEVSATQNVTLKFVPAGRLACRMVINSVLVNGVSGTTVTPSEFTVDSSDPFEQQLSLGFQNQDFNGGTNASRLEVSCNGIIKTIPFTAQLQDVSISLNPKSLAMAPGTSKQVAVTISPRGGFKGNVSVSATDLPTGASVTPQTAQLNVTNSNDITQSFTVTSQVDMKPILTAANFKVNDVNFSRSQDFDFKVVDAEIYISPIFGYYYNTMLETSSIQMNSSVYSIPGIQTGFDASVIWNIVSGGGKLTNPTDSSAIFTAPAVNILTYVVIKATSNWDMTKSVTRTLIIQPVAVELGRIPEFNAGSEVYFGDYSAIFSGGTPPNNVLKQNVKAGETVTFIGSTIVAGSSNPNSSGGVSTGSGVTWEDSSGLGVVNGSSFKLTIPNDVGQVITLTVRSISNPDKFVQVLFTVTE